MASSWITTLTTDWAGFGYTSNIIVSSSVLFGSSPRHSQSAVIISLIVMASPSSHEVPGSGPSGHRSSASQVPSRSESWNVPLHTQSSATRSSTVHASLSLQLSPMLSSRAGQ